MLAPNPSCLPHNIRTACLRLLVFAKPRTVFRTHCPSPMGSGVRGETDSEQWMTGSLSNEAHKRGSRLFRMTVTWEGLLVWGVSFNPVQCISRNLQKEILG